jgi:hypothetical protein
MEIKIEKGFEIPKAKTGILSEAIRKLIRSEVGDSIYIPNKAGKNARLRAHQIGGPGWCITRTDADGTRVWKIAEPKNGFIDVL